MERVAPEMTSKVLLAVLPPEMVSVPFLTLVRPA
jgi:hypothetical protein